MRNAHSRAVIDHLVFGCDHLQNGTSYLEQMLVLVFLLAGNTPLWQRIIGF